MEEDRLITVAIHTYDRAIELKNLLEREGVKAVLHNVNLSTPVVSSGVRVRIKECDLPHALRIIENLEIFADASRSDNGVEPIVLVPVDFSEYSFKATMIAFDIAYSNKASVKLLHSFINPALSKRVQLTDSFSFELSESQEVEKVLMRNARAAMDSFEDRLKEQIKVGNVKPVKFNDLILEGVPEDVINETAKTLSPMLIVMGTRGADRKEEELIGSVTAEVLDSCRFPVFSIPENIHIENASQISHIIFFSNLEQEDFLAMETIYQLVKNLRPKSSNDTKSKIEVTIAHVPGKKDRNDNDFDASKNLLDYCKSHYPDILFKVEKLRPDNFKDDYQRVANNHNVNLVALPNKKRNVFFRFFNPSLAHKLLLHTDVPMLVIPV